MLELDVEARDGARIVVPRGRLSMVSARPFREQVAETIAAADGALIVLDLSQTDFVDSSGLGAIVACLKTARQAGGDLRLAAPSEQVTMVLRLTNLDRVIRPRVTVEEALRD
ncbi:STAS domain-containing protein [Microbacterium sp. JZ31]|uniref:STAS domain-containing protein n=1 Tax=Microbacterium sp. JZ31 TaxID=1906274 RepID=UPI001933441A|nr:STAS domain-containing protein [Microbacterium sp. JZ31]